MLVAMLAQILGLLLDLLTGRWHSVATKDLEILVLRQQLRVVYRTQVHALRPARADKLTREVLTSKRKAAATRARSPWRPSLLLFTPETVLRWHRELVRHKWTLRRRRASGRPSVSAEVEELILRLAHENPRWGYSRVSGELNQRCSADKKMYDVSADIAQQRCCTSYSVSTLSAASSPRGALRDGQISAMVQPLLVGHSPHDVCAQRRVVVGRPAPTKDPVSALLVDVTTGRSSSCPGAAHNLRPACGHSAACCP